MKIIGIRQVSYNRKSDNSHVEGVELTYTYPRKNTVGVCADTAFISKVVIDELGGILPNLEDDVEFTYNRYGKVAGWSFR